MELSLDTYIYDLPPERIAKFPLENRGQSKLLVYKNGQIKHKLFSEITAELPSNSMLVFNETKVIQARLIFYKDSGARIEIFCLEPNNLNDEISHILHEQKKTTWKCLVGNKRKWKKDSILIKQTEKGGEQIRLLAKQMEDKGKDVVIEFEWNSGHSFSEILTLFGDTPIPPYLERESQESDKQTYQTVYARMDGAVAAPTAGLHFTPEILEELKQNGQQCEFITLHVSAGTFQPISKENVLEHPMHSEQIVFKRENIVNLINHRGKIICVGTTSLRALESLFWFGAGLIHNKLASFRIEKLFPYSFNENEIPDRKASLQAVLNYMDKHGFEQLIGETQIFIFPSYTFRMCDGLITNYHMPKSTLILLVAAFVGEDWNRIYEEALAHKYRFLSYGDSSLLLPH
ncbi:S-adenosylmethionine:tRNA ribosyltransferase-isomerase [Bacteroidota bacterium]